jgi:SAM-dependent methyltransferase
MLGPAALAFDAVADRFDERFGPWRSVAAQRRAVRARLLALFPAGARVLEVGGGTGEDARWLAERGREVLLTDASPAMVRVAGAKLAPLGMPAPRAVAAESLDAPELLAAGPFDGAFSNFAALNCVADLAPVGRALARLVRPGGRVALVLFGTCAPGEWVTQLARGGTDGGRWRAAARRFARGDVAARLGGRHFTVRYHRAADVRAALGPAFRPSGRRGVGVFVPPSAAEPWISGRPRLLAALEALDRAASRPLAALGDHVLYEFERVP